MGPCDPWPDKPTQALVEAVWQLTQPDVGQQPPALLPHYAIAVARAETPDAKNALIRAYKARYK